MYISQKSNYLQILDFISELDPPAFNRFVVLPLLEKFINHCESSYKDIDISKSQKRKRQSICFGVLYGVQKGNFMEKWVKKFNNEEDKKMGDFTLNKISFTQNKKGEPITEVFATSYDQEIINIIGNKGTDYTNKINMDKKVKVLDLSFSNNKLHLVDDKENCIFNDPKVFDDISDKMAVSRLYTRTSSSTYLLNFDKVIPEVKKIKRQIESERKKDVLDNL